MIWQEFSRNFLCSSFIGQQHTEPSPDKHHASFTVHREPNPPRPAKTRCYSVLTQHGYVVTTEHTREPKNMYLGWTSGVGFVTAGCCCLRNVPTSCRRGILRGTIVNRTYGAHKNLYISLFLTILGPINYGSPHSIVHVSPVARNSVKNFLCTNSTKRWMQHSSSSVICGCGGGGGGGGGGCAGV